MLQQSSMTLNTRSNTTSAIVSQVGGLQFIILHSYTAKMKSSYSRYELMALVGNTDS